MAATAREKEFRDKAAVVGIGYSRSPQSPGGFSKSSGVSVLQLAIRATKEAAADAGIDPKEIEGAVNYQLGDSIMTMQLLSALGVKNQTYNSSNMGGGNLPSFIISQAAEAVTHGVAKYVVAFRAMNGRSGVRMGQLGGGAGNRVGGPAQFSAPYGMAGPPSSYAMTASRYMDVYGVTSEDFAAWSVNSRTNALKNPRAMMRTPITVEDHQNSRMVVAPYHLLDCCLETDVACAMIITTTENARTLNRTPILISSAIGGWTRTDEPVDTGMKIIGPRLMDAAGVSLEDIDIFMPYDNFTDCPMRMVEDMGWCKRGEVGDFIRAGHLTLDGTIPVETQGGLMSEGYAHGFNNALEAVQQLRGEAEDYCPNWKNGEHTYDRSICRQVRDPQVALHTGVEGSCGIIFKRG